MRSDFAMLILSHGRADRVVTVKALRKAGYTGQIYIVIDDEDDMAAKYYENFGDRVIEFSKEKYANKFDRADNFDDKKAIVYARNASFDIAEDLGLKYFMQLDDDYTSFRFKFNTRGNFSSSKIKDLDYIIDRFIELYEKTDAKTIAFAQGGDFIGGASNRMGEYLRMKRKAMNTFLCKTSNPVKFRGTMNEDVNMYVRRGQLGDLVYTTNVIGIDQKSTQSNENGMTDIYLDNGTYVKSFYTILFSPSCVALRKMGAISPRIHHCIKWRNAVPKIISDEYKKD